MQYFIDVLMVGREAHYNKRIHRGTLSYKELANICHNLTLFFSILIMVLFNFIVPYPKKSKQTQIGSLK